MPGERWTFTFELPPNVGNPGRFMARILKHLWRCWGVKATAIVETLSAATAPTTAKDRA